MSSPLDIPVSRPSSAMASPAGTQTMRSRSRAQSISSDRPSTIAYSFMSPPQTISPEAAYIAASAASQIVTNDHDSHAEAWFDQHGIEPCREPAVVSPAALQLVNNFLDQLLFNFLNVARSISLSALRPAVTEVLKPKLAKDAINQADEELREYLGGDDEDIMAQSQETPSPADWDLELAWKRTRLRCMVYSSLGDMEEEDEDYYMEQGHLGSAYDDRSAESSVSPAVAIFLTSILEFMGEQALIVAGQAAYHRMRLKYEKELKEGARSPTVVADKIVVEELDMERVALDRTLGRLWRSWKKKIRTPGSGTLDRLNRSQSIDSMRAAYGGHLRSPSTTAELMVPATVPEPAPEPMNVELEIPAYEKPADEKAPEPEPEPQPAQEEEAPLTEAEIAARIPLPEGPNDVAEIEVPGLAHYSDEEPDEDETQKEKVHPRPKSLMILPVGNSPLTPPPSQPHTPDIPSRKRANSLPAPPPRRYISPSDEPGTEDKGQQSPPDSPKAEPDVQSEPAATAEPPKEDRPKEEPKPAPEPAKEDEKDDPEDDGGEVSIEEPRIVRSSRVSIVGGRASPALSDPGRPSAINTNLPRSPSIHSARLIDVSPRSPVVAGGSRRNSVIQTESARHSNLSLVSRTSTPSIPEERAPASLAESSTSANAGGSRSSAGKLAVPGAKGSAAHEDSAASPATPAVASQVLPAPASASAPSKEPSELSNQSSGSSESAQSPSPSKPATKVTVLPPTSTPVPTAPASSSFMVDSMPVLPEDQEIKSIPPRNESFRYRPSTSPKPPPSIPERNAGRQAIANTSAQRQPPTTIGQVSVERAYPRNLTEQSRSQELLSAAPRGSPASTKGLKPIRTSSDEGSRPRDVARDFEELIQSDETIQYTLTPESMRDLDPQSQSLLGSSSGTPIVAVRSRKSEDRHSGDAKTRPTSRASGSSSYSPIDGPSTKHGARVLPTMPTKGRPGPQARDARVVRDRESLAELAEFLRSTAPSAPPKVTPIITSFRVVGGASGPPGTDSLSKLPTDPTQPSTTQTALSATATTTTTSAATRRPKFQAREAIVDTKDNSDLIDFIRRGPPSASGNPRIPKDIAPFRSTMDSELMSNALGGKAVDANLRSLDPRSSNASTNESSLPPSVHSSINSHSALLKKQAGSSYDAMNSTEGSFPKRKTRRVRDPYAIDFSDEEDEDIDSLAQLPPKRPHTSKEESLIDFLNSYTPPPAPPPQPFNISQTQALLQAKQGLQEPQQQQVPSKPKKKASAPSLMARLTRRDSSAAMRPSSPKSGFSAGGTPNSPPQLPSVSRALSSRASAGSGTGSAKFIPLQVNMPDGDPYAPPLTRAGTAGSAGFGSTSTPTSSDNNSNVPKTSGSITSTAQSQRRVPMKKFEPREPIAVPTRATADLAQFLRSSEPPPPGVLPPSLPQGGSGVGEKEDGEKKRGGMFARRKKSTLAL